MGELDRDIERCLTECACGGDVAKRARCSCAEGRTRETKRALLGERQRLVEEMHVAQHGIDRIDHLLRRVSREMSGQKPGLAQEPEPESPAETELARCPEEDE